jgi:hypothetical protein
MEIHARIIFKIPGDMVMATLSERAGILNQDSSGFLMIGIARLHCLLHAKATSHNTREKKKSSSCLPT